MKETFTKEQEQEVSLKKDAIVFCRTKPINGWIFVETMDGDRGYAPETYLSPLFLKVSEKNSGYSRPSDVVGPQSTHQELDYSVNVTLRSARGSQRRSQCFIYSSLRTREISEKRKDGARLSRHTHLHALSVQTQSENSCDYADMF